MAGIHIVIHFNRQGGYEDEALGLARRLFARLDEAIDSLALVPVTDEDLDLHLNGRLVHSQRQTGRPPMAADLLAAMRDDASAGEDR
jgi:predicted Rdx family selenoprotein